MADLTYAQLKQAWLDNAKGTPYDSNDWASTMAAVAEADQSTQPVSPAGVQQLATQGADSFPSHKSGAFKAFVNTSTSPQPVGDSGSGGAGAAAAQAAGQVSQAVANIAATQSQSVASSCAWKLSPFSGGGLIQDVLGHPSWCVLSWSQIRALASTGILLGGAAVFLFATATLLASTAPGQAVTRIAGRVAGVVGLAA